MKYEWYFEYGSSIFYYRREELIEQDDWSIEKCMRQITSYCLREKMVLAKPVYNNSGDLLLGTGVILTTQYIHKIKSLGLINIYVDKQSSRNLDTEDKLADLIKFRIFEGLNKRYNSSKYKEENSVSMNKVVDNITKNETVMINLTDLRLFDECTFNHSIDVLVLAMIMGKSLELENSELYELGIGAVLHDIGKMSIPQPVLNSSGELSKVELDIIRNHPEYGHDFLRWNSDVPLKSKVAILEHHERFDGTGYPANKKAEEISLYSKIISICDVFNAIISKRSYKEALSPTEAMEYIMSQSDLQFDIELVRVFSFEVSTYPIGASVKLSDGREGRVLENTPGFITRPTVKIRSGEIIKLSSEYLNVTVVNII